MQAQSRGVGGGDMEQAVKRGGGLWRTLLKTGMGLMALMLLVLAVAALWTQHRFQEPFMRTWSRALAPELAWQRAKYPSIDWAFAAVDLFMVENSRASFSLLHPARDEPLSISPVIGPRVLNGALPVRYTPDGVPLPAMSEGGGNAPAGVIQILPAADAVVVSDERELANAIRNAQPGDHILLNPGTYLVRHGLEAVADGTPDAPIFLRAAKLGDAQLQIRTVEGIILHGAHWVIENLSMEGVCPIDDYCEHAVHAVGGARSTVIRNNVMRNFNAPIKVNLLRKRDKVPDYGLIEGNRFSNDRPRKTSRSVTLIDIVGADGWRVTSNFIADFAKDGGDHTSYAGFIKGASRGGVFERNLVVCEWKHKGGVRLGLSLGGGGTVDYACRDGACGVESDGGVIRNNVILNCPNDVGVYLNKAANAVVHNNLLAGTAGLDARFAETDAYIFNNIIDGRVQKRDGGKAQLENNLHSSWRAALLLPVSRSVVANPQAGDFSITGAGAISGKGRPLPSGLSDFCGREHNGAQPDIGPFRVATESPCAAPGLSLKQ